MIAKQLLWGPFETGEGTTVFAVYKTTVGDKELFFDTFNDWYQFNKGMPREADDYTYGTITSKSEGHL